MRDSQSDLPFDLPSDAESVGLVIKEEVGASCETRGRPYLYAVDTKTGRALVIRPDCKMWKCPHCAQVNRMKWTYRIKYGIDLYEKEQGDKFWFVTLTTHRSIKTFEKSVYVWRAAWDKLYHRMKRVNPKPMHYVLLPELAPETGRLHAHMIVNYSFGATYDRTDKKGRDWYKCQWIKDNPAECGLGYMNDIRPVANSGLAAWYVSKYVGKSLGVNDWPENFKRIRPNVGFPQQPERPDRIDGLEWKIIQAHNFTRIVETLWGEGLNVINLNTGELIEGIDLP